MAITDVLTSNTLVESVKRRASVPTNQSTFELTDFLQFANEEMRLSLVPAILSLHEDFLLFEVEVPIVNNQREYVIPSRAVGNKLKDLQIKYNDDSYQELTRIGIGERFSDIADVNLRSYYLKNNKVVFQSPLNVNASLVFIFFIKPSNLVQEERIGIIRGINRTTGEIIVDGIPDDFSLTEKFDLYKAESPNSILMIDLTASNINTTSKSITLDPDDLPSELELGDHIALAGECMIPQVPSDLHPMLAQMVAIRIYEAQGDEAGLRAGMVKLQQMETAAGIILDNRVEDSPPKIVNRHGLLRTAVNAKRFNRR